MSFPTEIIRGTLTDIAFKEPNNRLCYDVDDIHPISTRTILIPQGFDYEEFIAITEAIHTALAGMEES
ncbi:hypothetical protein [Bifidobacterium vansinderenii]|uniref:Uncharacterized protein n=1 Tax=Bifidobacterium vansinderenii TaxID=1984871 RepID=A0A229W1A4_9BIFI|nr:hypothetical protein [Bifidobacterium vansinderenii]OXN01639.1 hypothetical protein Tam10B_0081 [Bifidobacterium vansinderenii]